MEYLTLADQAGAPPGEVTSQGSVAGNCQVREPSCRTGDNGLVAESWMIDELAHAGPEHLDPAFSAISIPGPPADGVYTRNALHQLPDFWKALALGRIARMLRPGGVSRATNRTRNNATAASNRQPASPPARPAQAASRARRQQRALPRAIRAFDRDHVAGCGRQRHVPGHHHAAGRPQPACAYDQGGVIRITHGR